MVSSKSVKPKKSTKKVPEPIVEVVSEPEPEQEVPKPKRKSKAKPKPKVEKVDSVEDEDEDEEQEVIVQPSFLEVYKQAMEDLTAIKTQIKAHESIVRSLKALYKEDLKANKSSKKRRRKNAEPELNEDGTVKVRKPHGCIKPVLLSEQLTDFLGIESGSMLPPPTVTKLFAEYVRAHECYDPSNKTIIIPDAKILELLGEPEFFYRKKKPEDGKGYNYFNLQSYMKRQKHFIRPEAVVSDTSI